MAKLPFKNPAVALEDIISAYFQCDFLIPHAKIYQNSTFQLISASNLGTPFFHKQSIFDPCP